jgi:hypothetical protein
MVERTWPNLSAPLLSHKRVCPRPKVGPSPRLYNPAALKIWILEVHVNKANIVGRRQNFHWQAASRAQWAEDKNAERFARCEDILCRRRELSTGDCAGMRREMCEGRELGDERGLWAIWPHKKVEQVKMSQESEHGLAWIHVTEYKQPLDAESS